MRVGVQALVLICLDVFDSVHDLATDLEIDRANALRAITFNGVNGFVPAGR
jgi:hypothetical protein